MPKQPDSAVPGEPDRLARPGSSAHTAAAPSTTLLRPSPQPSPPPLSLLPPLLPPLLPAALLALFAGSLNLFAFAPFGWWPLQLACTALLFALVMQAASVRRAALFGWLYSFAWCAAGVHWLYVSLHDLGGMPSWLTVAAIATLALGLGLLVGAATGGARWLQTRLQMSSAVTLLLPLPALFMLAEWTRSWIFTGFPWLSTGYAHTDAPLAGFAPLLGVYGIGWIAAMMAAALVWLHGSLRPMIQRKAALQAYLRPLLLPLLFIVAPLISGQLLRSVAWTHPQGNPITVRLLQGNIPQEMKFDQSSLGKTLGLYDAMIMAAPADLIATPETALPVTRQQLPADYLQRLADFAGRSNSHLLIGIPITDGPGVYTNSAVVIEPAPKAAGGLPVPIASVPAVYRYDKHHLVPFGEFIPPGFRWFVDFMHMPLGDQTRGTLLQAPFAVRDQWVMPNICYEDLFGEEIAAQMRARFALQLPVQTILLNISNIAWFGNTIAVPQHLQISRMRSLETGRPMLRSTNTGATAVIGPHGEIQAQLAPFVQGTLAATVQGHAGLTPYVVVGNAAAISLVVLMLALAVALTRRRRRPT